MIVIKIKRSIARITFAIIVIIIIITIIMMLITFTIEIIIIIIPIMIITWIVTFTLYLHFLRVFASDFWTVSQEGEEKDADPYPVLRELLSELADNASSLAAYRGLPLAALFTDR